MAPTPMSVSQLLQRNKDYTTSHQPIPSFSEIADLGIFPPHIVVVTCADPRCEPTHYFNLTERDMVIVMRNVCGHLTLSTCADIVALDSLVGITDVLVVHHSDCGALMLKDNNVRAHIKKTTRHNDEKVDGMTFGAITDLEQSVRDDMDSFKRSPLVRAELKEHITGYVYDLVTGALTPVKH